MFDHIILYYCRLEVRAIMQDVPDLELADFYRAKCYAAMYEASPHLQ